MASRYQSWSRTKLISRIAELEKALAEYTGCAIQTNNNNASNTILASKKIAALQAKPLIKIAIKFTYLGWNFSGNQYQPESEPPAVENTLIDALRRLNLVEDFESTKLSRSGRTDRGVSCLGQVCTLYVRDFKFSSPSDYVDRLNRVLPETIRVLSCAVNLSENFDARFSCRGRIYHYYFLDKIENISLDIEKMQDAAAMLVGKRDFRNFCTIDAARQITDYTREIIQAKITKIDKYPFIDGSQLYRFEIHGTAFLYHQIRMIMQILFLIGSGNEDKDLMTKLLDPEKIEARPSYQIASGLPLILYDTIYDDDLKWYHARDPRSTLRATSENYHSHLMRLLISSEQLELVKLNGDYPESLMNLKGVHTGGGCLRLAQKYTPVLELPPTITFEQKNENWRNKKQKITQE